MFCTFWLQKLLFATAAPNFGASDVWKVVRNWRVLYIFTSKCTFRHSGVHFFDIWTSKSALGPSVFLHVHLQMCFSPQRRAIFEHLNFQKWSEDYSFLTFWLWNVLFATRQKMLRGLQFFNILTFKCAFRHSGVQFLSIWTSKSGPRTTVFLTFWLWNVLFATAAYNFSASELPKVVRGLQFFNILTLKCAFRHSGVQFCDIVTSKNASELTCFVHFHFKMCFSPQRRTIFQHLNFQKWSRIVSFLTFSLQNVLFATAACDFSTSALPK